MTGPRDAMWACVRTSASVHDSQAAIPLMTMTSARVFYLYGLMDAAYDGAVTAKQSKPPGNVPLINRNFRGQHEAKAECAGEAARMKLIGLSGADDALHNFRAIAGRVNARLKDESGGRFVRGRGAIKVKCHLMSAALVLAAARISAPELSDLLRLDPRRRCPFQRRENHSADEFCKRLQGLWPEPNLTRYG